MNRNETIRHYLDEIVAIAKDDSHGYSQSSRWGHPNYDCSSLVITVLQHAGLPVKDLGATYTGNMLKPLLQVGFKIVTSQIDLTTGNGLQPGDILLTPGKHTAICIDQNSTCEATTSRTNQADQIRTRPYRNYPWTHVLRLDLEHTTPDDQARNSAP